jgi:hypothetical protein
MHFFHCVCLPKTGITLFINQRRYNHLDLPVIICNIIVVVIDDIAERQQHFQAASHLPRMMSANGGRVGGATRRSIVPSPLPLDRNDVLVPSSFCVAPPTATAVVGGRHYSIIIVPLLQTVAVIVLVFLFPSKRTPIGS